MTESECVFHLSLKLGVIGLSVARLAALCEEFDVLRPGSHEFALPMLSAASEFIDKSTAYHKEILRLQRESPPNPGRKDGR